MNPFVRLIYALLIAAAMVSFIGVGIYTFYPEPQPPTYPQQTQPLEKGIAQPASPANNSDTNEYQQAYDGYQTDLKAYYRNVSIVGSALAVITVAVGLYIRRRTDVIGEGLAFGGVGGAIYAIVTASIGDDRIMRFVAVTLFLASALLIVYTEFNVTRLPITKDLRKHR